jgi:hypothetical protein
MRAARASSAPRGMMSVMPGDLRYLVHFFNDDRYLFKTITMADDARADAICSAITADKGWYWVRFSDSERRDYLRRRRFVEEAMYEDYTQAYGALADRVPIYFYLVPDLSEQQAIEMARQRTIHDEAQPHVLMVDIEDIDDTRNMTFTLNDSHTAYRARIAAAGLSFGRDDAVRVALPDHGKIFPFSMLDQVHRVYGPRHITYEVQVWDHRMVERLRYVRLPYARTSTTSA